MNYFIDNLIYFMIGIPALLIIGGFMVIKLGLTHRILDILRPTTDKYISTKIFCEDKQIRDRKMKIGRYCISDDKKRRSFYLVHDLLFSQGHKKILCLTERSEWPLDFHSKITPEDKKKYPKAQRIFIDTTGDIASTSAKESQGNVMAMALSTIALAGAVVVITMGCIIFFTSKGA